MTRHARISARLKSEVTEQMERAYPLQDFADATFLEVDDGVDAFVNGSFGDH